MEWAKLGGITQQSRRGNAICKCFKIPRLCWVFNNKKPAGVRLHDASKWAKPWQINFAENKSRTGRKRTNCRQ